MKLENVLRELGAKKDCFPRCAEIPIVLYDRKDRITSGEDIHFVESLFVNNNGSFMDCIDFLKKLENNPPESMNIRIDENTVIFFYKTPQAKIFSRQPSVNPFQYVD